MADWRVAVQGTHTCLARVSVRQVFKMLPRKTKISDFGVPLAVDEHICGLEVSVHDGGHRLVQRLHPNTR